MKKETAADLSAAVSESRRAKAMAAVKKPEMEGDGYQKSGKIRQRLSQ